MATTTEDHLHGRQARRTSDPFGFDPYRLPIDGVTGRIDAEGLHPMGATRRRLAGVSSVLRRVARWTKVPIRKIGPGLLYVGLFAVVIWVGSEVVYTSAQPIVVPISTRLAEVPSYILPKIHIATVEPTRTPTPTPTILPTQTATPTPIKLPTVPKWFTTKTLIRIAGIVAGETYSQTDQGALNFLATQVMYDMIKGKGWLPASRWKAYAQPTHLSLQAANTALATYDEPLYKRCAFVGGYADGDYFKRVSTYKTPDIEFGSGTNVIQGWGCK